MPSACADTHSPKTNFQHYLLATLLPIFFLSLSFSSQLYDHIRIYSFTDTEIEGVQMISLLYAALTDLQKIRGYKQITIWRKEKGIERQMNALERRFLSRLHGSRWLTGFRTFSARKRGYTSRERGPSVIRNNLSPLKHLTENQAF